MITQYEVPDYLKAAMPQLAAQWQPARSGMAIYPCLQVFTDFTKKAIRRHNLDLVKKCCEFADRLYTNGDKVVRNAVENVFVYSFSAFLAGSRTEKLVIKSLIPASLYNVYLRQLMQSGC